MGTKDLKKLRLRQERQKVEGAKAMAEYKKAERAKFDRLVKLRTERAAREAAYGPKSRMDKARPAVDTRAKTKKTQR